MSYGRPSKDKKEILCWECENAYAHKCRKFRTLEPLDDIWEEYETFNMSVVYTSNGRVVTGYAVYKCKNFVRERKRNRWSF